MCLLRAESVVIIGVVDVLNILSFVLHFVGEMSLTSSYVLHVPANNISFVTVCFSVFNLNRIPLM